MIFENHIWKFFKLNKTALIYASAKGHTEIVKILVEQEGIDVKAEDILLFLTIFISIILDFKTIFGNSSNHLKQHL